MLRLIIVLAVSLVGIIRSSDLSHGRKPDEFKANMTDVHFLLWTRSNPGDSDYYELIIDDGEDLAASPFDASRPTHVLAHGWNSDGYGGWPLDAKTELLNYYDCNVISVDWGEIAININYLAVVNNLPQVGNHSGHFLDFLHTEGGLDLATVHATGHSLGAHMMGYMGASVINGPLGRVTGLDPAGPEFYNVSASERLDPSDAAFVEIIHTNACPLYGFCVGLKAETGHVDYYPNGGAHQPGCIIGGADWTELFTNESSHSRAPLYWVESITGAVAFTARPCDDWDTYLAGGCPDCGQGCLDMGMHASTELRGNYYLETNAASPYAQG